MQCAVSYILIRHCNAPLLFRKIAFFNHEGQLREAVATSTEYAAQRKSAETNSALARRLLGHDPFLAWGDGTRDKIMATFFYCALDPRSAGTTCKAFTDGDTFADSKVIDMATVLTTATLAAMRVYMAFILMGMGEDQRWWTTKAVVCNLARVQSLLWEVRAGVVACLCVCVQGPSTPPCSRTSARHSHTHAHTHTHRRCSWSPTKYTGKIARSRSSSCSGSRRKCLPRESRGAKTPPMKTRHPSAPRPPKTLISPTWHEQVHCNVPS